MGIDDAPASDLEAVNPQRILGWTGVLAVVVIAVAGWMIVAERNKRVSDASWAERQFGLRAPIPVKLDARYQDRDHDLIADPPETDACIRPETLIFSYIAADEKPAEAWQPFVDRMSAAIGRPLDHQPFRSVRQQLQALEDGKLHVTALNTGSVPRAVTQHGFVPVSIKANKEGRWEINMKLIVPRHSSVEKVEDLRGEAITFTNPSSFSGFKFAVVLLQNEFGLRLGEDFDYRFSTSHFESMRLAAAGELTAAVVASDLLDAAYADGSVPPGSVREVYTSAPFPAAAFGYCHQLDPEIAAKLRDFLVDCDMTGTPFDAGGSGGMLSATNYRNDWEAVRAVDASIAYRDEPVPEGGPRPERPSGTDSTGERGDGRVEAAS